MADGSWFVLTTKPQGEFPAEKELMAAGLKIMLPRFTRRISRHAKRQIERKEPHMRRYICVAADTETVVWREAKAAKHVSKPLMSGQSIARLREPEAARVEAMAEIDPDAKEPTKGQGFEIGQRVRFTEGPFIGYDGPVTYVGSDIVRVERQMFGRKLEIHASFKIIEAYAG